MKTFQTYIIGLLLLAGFAARADSVVNSVHNLSVNGPGTIKASSESDACIFCHTVHRANGETPQPTLERPERRHSAAKRCFAALFELP